MKMTEKPESLSKARMWTALLFALIAGIMAWWSWTHTGERGFLYVIIGLLIVAAAVLVFGAFKKYPNTDNS